MKTMNLLAAVALLSFSGWARQARGQEARTGPGPAAGDSAGPRVAAPGHYYVSQLDPNADDANPGTVTAPFKSINGCLRSVKKTLAQVGDRQIRFRVISKEGQVSLTAVVKKES